MADIMIWVAIAVVVIAVWLLAGRFSSGRTGMGEPPRSETMRGGMY